MSREGEAAAMLTKDKNRESVIVRTSIVGILVNLLLAILKAGIGLLSHSLALVLDGVNNVTDAMSSVITILGARLAGRQPDKKHPYGYGRIEYMSQMIVAGIVLYAGITSLVESVKKILDPGRPDFSYLMLFLILMAVAAKLVLGAYVKSRGRAVKSGALIASGADASSDAVLSASVLVSALIFTFTGINIEAYIGILIAAFIIKSGLELIRGALDEILGQRVEADLSAQVKEIVLSFPEVHGVYDLFLNNYGPDRFIGSLHIELDDAATAIEIDRLTREIAEKVYSRSGVLLSAVGIYAVNNGDDRISAMRSDIQKRVSAHEGVIQTHGYYLDLDKRMISFDLILDYAVENREELFQSIQAEIREAYPDFEVHVTQDLDVSD